MYKITIGTEKQFVKIQVAGKTYPDSMDRWDGGWLNSKINLLLGSFNGIFNANLRIDEFKNFLKDVERLNKTLKGQATYQSMEDWLIIEIENVDSLGNLSASIVAKDSLEGNNKISGTIMLDQTYLKTIIAEIKAMLGKLENS